MFRQDLATKALWSLAIFWCGAQRATPLTLLATSVPSVHLRPGSRSRRPLRAPLPERAAGGSALRWAPRRSRGTGARGAARLLLPAALKTGLVSLVPPSAVATLSPCQMQAIALPEEICWLLEGNSWLSARPLS